MEKLDTRGAYNKCQKCKHKFKFYYRNDKDLWIQSNYPCPSCGELYCTKPTHERKLFIIQLDYFDTDKDKFYKLLYAQLFPYTKSLFLKNYRNRTSILTEEVDYYVNNAINFLIEEYLIDETFKIEHSFAGFINYKLKQALYCKAEKGDNHVADSLDYQFEDDNFVEYEDKKQTVLNSIEDDENRVNLCIYIYRLIIAYNVRIDEEDDIIRLLAVLHSLKKGEKYSDKLFQNEIKEDQVYKQYKTFNKQGKMIFLETMDIIRKELKQLIQ